MYFKETRHSLLKRWKEYNTLLEVHSVVKVHRNSIVRRREPLSKMLAMLVQPIFSSACLTLSSIPRHFKKSKLKALAWLNSLFRRCRNSAHSSSFSSLMSDSLIRMLIPG
uniref:Uncharacterized protein n=1 Tax=Arundo donax TaxID=35708 RepID=A0A0A8XQW3_ARUDO